MNSDSGELRQVRRQAGAVGCGRSPTRSASSPACSPPVSVHWPSVRSSVDDDDRPGEGGGPRESTPARCGSRRRSTCSTAMVSASSSIEMPIGSGRFQAGGAGDRRRARMSTPALVSTSRRRRTAPVRAGRRRRSAAQREVGAADQAGDLGERRNRDARAVRAVHRDGERTGVLRAARRSPRRAAEHGAAAGDRDREGVTGPDVAEGDLQIGRPRRGPGSTDHGCSAVTVISAAVIAAGRTGRSVTPMCEMAIPPRKPASAAGQRGERVGPAGRHRCRGDRGQGELSRIGLDRGRASRRRAAVTWTGISTAPTVRMPSVPLIIDGQPRHTRQGVRGPVRWCVCWRCWCCR